MPPPLPHAYPQHRQSNTGRNVAIGCSVAFAIFVLICVIGAWLIVANFKTLASEAVAAALTAAISDAPLPAEQKGRLIARVNQIKDDFKADKISVKQLEAILNGITQSPLLPAGAAIFAEQVYLNPSSLSDAEKQQGRRSVQRVVRGAIDKKITEQQLDHVMAPMMEADSSSRGGQKLKQKVTDAELREFLKRAEAAADAAAIPDEDFQINLADEFDKVVDKALNPQAAEPGPEPVK